MKILLIGSGGREHALAWKLAQSPRLTKLFVAPGNPGIAALAECVNIASDDIEGLLKFAQREHIDWTMVGPEAPLCAGLVDRFTAEGLKAFGPTAAAAQLEGSKIFSKEFMIEHSIPTARFARLKSADAVQTYIRECGLPQVIKADGLAAGKGVFVCHQASDVTTALQHIFVDKLFGDAGSEVVVEECLTGTEASFLVIADGKHALALAPAQDHKTIFENNQGPNTGGMGTFCPTETLSTELQNELIRTVVQPTLDGMAKRGAPFQGILYVGVMLTQHGPKVLEFNVRFGDPETQVILPRLKTDLLTIFEACAAQKLNQLTLEWESRHAVCVVLASAGYPGTYQKGDRISGLDGIQDPNVIVFHAGTKLENGHILTNGGRVLGVTGLGTDREQARHRAYAAVDKISWAGMQFRRDIGVS